MARMFGALLLALVVFSSADAQETKRGQIDVDSIFKKLDSNADGKLQKEEFLKMSDRFKDKEKAREKLVSAFVRIDSAKAGFLSKDQFRTYLDATKRKDGER